MRYRGVWKDVLCCSGDFLAACCLLQANSVGRLSSQLQQGGGGGGLRNSPETIFPTPDKQDELFAVAWPQRQCRGTFSCSDGCVT